MDTNYQKEERTFDNYSNDWINYRKTPRYQYLRKYILKLIKDFDKPENRILELGCGISPFLGELKKSTNYGLDISQTLIDKNKSQTATFIKGNVVNCSSYFKVKFDLIFMVGLLHHINGKDHPKVLKQVKKLLKSQGYFILVEPNMISITGIYYLLRIVLTQLFNGNTIRNLIGFYSEDEKYIFPNRVLNQLRILNFETVKAYSIMPLRLPPVKSLQKINIQPVNELLYPVVSKLLYGGTSLVIVCKKKQ